VGWDWVHLVRRPLAPDDRRWWVWSSMWNENWRRKPKYSEKTASVTVCPPQIQHDLIWARTRAAVMESRRLTSGVMARPRINLTQKQDPSWEADTHTSGREISRVLWKSKVQWLVHKSRQTSYPESNKLSTYKPEHNAEIFRRDKSPPC
jgi:hypothetical protein